MVCKKDCTHTQILVVVEYKITVYATAIGGVLRLLTDWGTMHRDKLRKER
jgi:DNA-binding HxlR family transcriptional regulator